MLGKLQAEENESFNHLSGTQNKGWLGERERERERDYQNSICLYEPEDIWPHIRLKQKA